MICTPNVSYLQVDNVQLKILPHAGKERHKNTRFFILDEKVPWTRTLTHHHQFIIRSVPMPNDVINRGQVQGCVVVKKKKNLHVFKGRLQLCAGRKFIILVSI